MENEPMSHDDAGIEGAGHRSRKGVWNRLRGRGLLQESDLIRIYRIAQQQRVTPEFAAVALGVVTSKQIQEG